MAGPAIAVGLNKKRGLTKAPSKRMSPMRPIFFSRRAELVVLLTPDSSIGSFSEMPTFTSLRADPCQCLQNGFLMRVFVVLVSPSLPFPCHQSLALSGFCFPTLNQAAYYGAAY